MNDEFQLALLGNASAIQWSEVPEASAEVMVAAVAREVARGGRICAWFGVPEESGTRIAAVLAYDAENTLQVARSFPFRGAYPALTVLCPQAHLFERELWEQHGLRPEGHPWLKPVRLGDGHAPVMQDFFQVSGPEVHEVAVGPVHAGIIEPGHFRFQCAGEEVMHLEIALGYQHRGIERALEGGPHPSSINQVEAAAGDTSIAHATAYAMAMETLAGIEAPLAAQWLRAITLELERLANHAGDLGALANDVAFLPTSSACGKVRGDFLNLTALICGNRFGRGLVRPGGCRHEVETDRARSLMETLTAAVQEVDQAAAWLWESAAVVSRFESTGALTAEQGLELGLVGPAARSCGLVRDVRFDHPGGWHRFAQVPVAVWPGGDVFARARVRWLELQRSGKFIAEQLGEAPGGENVLPIGGLAPDTLTVALVEGWRGEVCHVALTGATGSIRRYKIVDPSFHNWSGLALALRGQAISDFPLCNKSFDLSYCGFDL